MSKKKMMRHRAVTIFPVVLLAGIASASLNDELISNNVVDTQADAVFTYTSRMVVIEWCITGHESVDLQVEDMIGETIEVNETGLTGQSYDWQVPRGGSYIVRVRAVYANGTVSDWNESLTNGSVQATGCASGQNFLVNAITAPPGDGGFEP